MSRVHFMVTASGQDYALNGPVLGAPNIEDIAHHLAQINRFTGAARRPESVAEHSLLCDDIAADMGWPVKLRRAVFSHDWHEAYTTDVSAPVKSVLAFVTDALSQFEARHAQHIRHTFGVADWSLCASDVRRVDLIALATERRDLMPKPTPLSGEWLVLRNVQPWSFNLMHEANASRNWLDWRAAFLARFRYLWPE